MAKVLIVEDNPANMTLAIFLLESAGRRMRRLHRQAPGV